MCPLTHFCVCQIGPSRKSARIYVACRLALRVEVCMFSLVSLGYRVQYRKPKTKVITLTNHNRCKQHNGPIRSRSKYM